MYVNIEGKHESVLYVEVKYVDVVYVNIEGRHESVLYVEVKYVDVVYVNMRHALPRTDRGRQDVIAPPPPHVLSQHERHCKSITARVCIFNNSAGPLQAPAPKHTARTLPAKDNNGIEDAFGTPVSHPKLVSPWIIEDPDVGYVCWVKTIHVCRA